MTQPAGYLVTRSDRTRALILDQNNAVEKAALGRGTVTPLFTAEQIASAVESMQGENDVITDFIRSLGEL